MRKLWFLVAVLIAASSVQAVNLGTNYFTNLDFDASTAESYPGGFDNTNSYDIPGWQDLHDTVTDAGIENVAWWHTYDNYSAFMSVDDGAYNLGTYTIQAGDEIVVSVVAKSWDGSSECTATLFYDDPTNVIGSFVTSVDGTWTTYNSTISATPGSVGGSLGIIIDNTATSGFLNFDEVTIETPPFVITGSPTGISDQTNQTIEATMIDLNDTFVSATLSLDGSVIATKSTSDGTTNIISSAEIVSIGVHTAQVVAVSSSDSMTTSWTFEVSQPAFLSITTSPTGTITNDSPTLQAVVIESFSTVDSAQMWLDGASVTPSIDRSLAPTTTISYASSGLANGVHTGKVVVVGDPSGLETNEWTFSVMVDPVKPITLLHHWDFEEGSGTNVLDSVGSAHGTIINTNFAWVDSTNGVAGGVDLFGGGTSGDYDASLIPASTNVGSYVDLPNGLLAALPAAVSFEITYIADDGGWWQRVWDMGCDSGHTENVVGTGAENIFLTPHSNSGSQGIRASVATNSPGYNHEYLQLEDTNGTLVGSLVHVVWIYDTDAKIGKLFVNGVLQDSKLMNSPWALSNFAGIDVNNWLGRAQYSSDSMFNGKIYDFRIYSGFMTQAEVTAHYNAALTSSGPTVDPVIQSISVSSGTVTLSWTAEDVGTYSVQRKTDLTGATWSTVVSNIPSGNQTTNVAASGADQEFYQVTGE